MKVETRNTIPVGQPAPQKSAVRVSETVYIAEGDSVAVVRFGNVPLIVPVRSKNNRPVRRQQYNSSRPTSPAPAPPYVTPALLSLEIAEDAPRAADVPNERRSAYATTIVPPPAEDK